MIPAVLLNFVCILSIAVNKQDSAVLSPDHGQSVKDSMVAWWHGRMTKKREHFIPAVEGGG